MDFPGNSRCKEEGIKVLAWIWWVLWCLFLFPMTQVLTKYQLEQNTFSIIRYWYWNWKNPTDYTKGYVQHNRSPSHCPVVIPHIDCQEIKGEKITDVVVERILKCYKFLWVLTKLTQQRTKKLYHQFINVGAVYLNTLTILF